MRKNEMIRYDNYNKRPMRFCRTHIRANPKARAYTIVRATQDDKKPAFQQHPYGTPLSFDELKDAHDIFSEFPSEHRNDCYAMYNINGEAMKKYYRHASSFERMYKEVVDAERKKNALIRFKIGPFYVYIGKDE